MTNLLDHSDEDLLRLLRTDQRNNVFGLLFKRHLPMVTGLCLHYLRAENIAHDAVMDIFEGLIRKVDKYDIENFKSWLLAYTRNHCLKLLTRSLRRDKEIFNTSIDPESVEIEIKEDHISDGKIEQLDAALDELKDHQRLCITMFYLQSKSYAEIEALTGYSNKEVKSYIQNGKKNLKKKIDLHFNK